MKKRYTHVESIPFGGGSFERYVWDNGLRVLVHVDRAAPVVSYQSWFGVGSRHEKPGKTGLAHLFEHLMFNETQNLKHGKFDRMMESRGAETNAATWVDWTYYYENLPAKDVGVAIKLESERMARLVLKEPQVASEKDVVANERMLRVDDDVDGTVSELLYKTAFTTHGYSWPTIGWMSDIRGFTPEDCEAFYAAYYAPNNAVIVVAGDVRVASVLAKIDEAYGDMPSSVLPVEDVTPEPPQREARHIEITRTTPAEKLALAYKGPAFGDADHVALTVLTEILFGGRASRIHRKLITDLELATEVRGWVSTFRFPGLFEMSATARNGISADRIAEELKKELARVKEELVTDREVARAVARLEVSSLQGMETPSGKAEQAGLYEIVLGDPAASWKRLAAYRRVTPAEIRYVARAYLRDETATSVIVRVAPETTESAAE